MKMRPPIQPHLYFVRPDGEFVALAEPSRYSDFYLSTMQDVVTAIAFLPAAIADAVEAIVKHEIAGDPYLHRSQHGSWKPNRL